MTSEHHSVTSRKHSLTSPSYIHFTDHDFRTKQVDDYHSCCHENSYYHAKGSDDHKHKVAYSYHQHMDQNAKQGYQDYHPVLHCSSTTISSRSDLPHLANHHISTPRLDHFNLQGKASRQRNFTRKHSQAIRELTISQRSSGSRSREGEAFARCSYSLRPSANRGERNNNGHGTCFNHFLDPAYNFYCHHYRSTKYGKIWNKDDQHHSSNSNQDDHQNWLYDYYDDQNNGCHLDVLHNCHSFGICICL